MPSLLFLAALSLCFAYVFPDSIICESTLTNTNSSNRKGIWWMFGNRLNNADVLQDVGNVLEIAAPWNAPAIVWKLAWKMHSFFLPLLHYFDNCRPKDTFVNLSVIWWKAITGNRWGSKLFDGGISYDMLPSFTRNIVQFPLCWLYPKLHHQNVALRTAYLDQMLSNEVDSALNKNSSIKVITLGCGFDARSLKFMEKYKDSRNNIEFYDIDQSSVIDQKMLMLQRFRNRRPIYELPHLLKADLNSLDQVEFCLDKIFEGPSGEGAPCCKAIFITEAVLMYLDDANVGPLLSLCMASSKKQNSDTEVSLCFADRFPQVQIPPAMTSPHVKADREAGPKVQYDALLAQERLEVESFLKRASNLQLSSWLAKPGRARHMGTAKMI